MVVVRYKQPETVDAARPADPDTLADAVRHLLHQTDLGSCPGSGDRRRSGSWTAHRNRRAVGARTARQDGFRPLSWRAQPRPMGGWRDFARSRPLNAVDIAQSPG